MSWPLVALEEVCEINVGRTPPRGENAYWEAGEHAWVSIGDMSRTRNITATKEMFSERARRECGMKPVPAGTVLMSFKLSIGKIAFAERELYTNEAIAALPVKNPRQLDPKYLAYALEALSFDGSGKRAVMGTTLNKANLKLIKIPLPPVPAQRRIVGTLDQADALRRLRRQSLSRLSDLGQAIFYKMFGDLVTNSNGWPEKSFRDLATRITVGVVVKPASYYRETGVPAIRGTNIKPEGIDLSDAVYFSEHDNEKILSKTRVWTNDLVIVRSGRPGLAALVPPEMSGINSIDVLILTPDTELVVPRFVKDLINSPMGKRLILSKSRGQVQQHFNVGSLAKANLYLPPYELQLEYLSRISAVDDAATRSDSSEEMLDSLFATLQHRAFQGEL